ncbi:MAG: DUF1822 family protein, partial [Gemmatimonadaceae bacterium]|nr:DUF1822 family protein [Gloeobacterales cyanobacterium ES-bin-141]
LNRLALTAVIPWLEEYVVEVVPWPGRAALPSFWELVNGTMVTIGSLRFLIVPTEASDHDEWQIPREWVDIAGWTADYYLAVQVVPDENLVRVRGYAPHQAVRLSVLDHDERVYCLEALRPIHMLWAECELCPQKALLSPAPQPLSLTEAQSLIARLADPDLQFPRLAVPFERWAALLVHGGWRQQLYERRQGLVPQWSVLRWIADGISDQAVCHGWRQSRELAGARNVQRMSEPLVRQLVIVGQPYELRVFPVPSPSERAWRFELRSLVGHVPGGFKLRLLTEDLKSFENNEDLALTAADQLYIEVVLERGEGLVWEVEPQPDCYEREILFF